MKEGALLQCAFFVGSSLDPCNALQGSRHYSEIVFIEGLLWKDFQARKGKP
jgi:hypothetical protein